MQDYLMFATDRNLSVLQIASEPANTFEYISSGKAIKENLITISEVSESGSVNDLKVTNKSKHYVYFMDGDILAGAKQNRVLNTSVLVEPMTEIIIPVSCVEQGRWRYKSRKFTDTDYSAPSMMRGPKMKQVDDNLKKHKEHYASQSKVWDNVSSFLFHSEVHSDTSSLSDIYDERAEAFDDFIRGFESFRDSKANGIAIIIEDKLLSIDIFNRRDICSEYYGKIIKGAAAEAFYMKKKKVKIDRETAVQITDSALQKMSEGRYSVVKGVGTGNEKRYDEHDFAGYELVYKDHLIQKSFLSLS